MNGKVMGSMSAAVLAITLIAGAPSVAHADGFTSISFSTGVGSSDCGPSRGGWGGGHGGGFSRGHDRGHFGSSYIGGGYNSRSSWSHRDGGSRVSFSFSSINRYDDCRPNIHYVRPCPPVVVHRPVIHRPVYVDPCPPVVVHRPVMVERPVVIERPVVYQPTIVSDTTEITEQPIVRTVYSPSTTVVSRPVVTKRVVVEEVPTSTRTTTVQDTTQIILTPYQAALEAIKDKKPGEAVDQLTAHLAANSGDLRAARILAIMLTEQKNTSEAVRVVIDAYKREPALARQPIDAAELNIGSGRLRDITNEAERYAAKMRTGSAYLTVAMLMQAEGRHEDALDMVARAAQAGLDQGIASTLEAALR
jgi:hypothetical protein